MIHGDPAQGISIKKRLPGHSPKNRVELARKEASHDLDCSLRRARVRLAIEDILDDGLPRAYTPELYQGKCAALFEHVYENYVGSGVSTYTAAA